MTKQDRETIQKLSYALRREINEYTAQLHLLTTVREATRAVESAMRICTTLGDKVTTIETDLLQSRLIALTNRDLGDLAADFQHKRAVFIEQYDVVADFVKTHRTVVEQEFKERSDKWHKRKIAVAAAKRAVTKATKRIIESLTSGCGTPANEVAEIIAAKRILESKEDEQFSEDKTLFYGLLKVHEEAGRLISAPV